MKAYAFPNEMGEGMTLRDWFAGHAMLTVVMSTPADARLSNKDISEFAYSMADSMLKERSNETA